MRRTELLAFAAVASADDFARGARASGGDRDDRGCNSGRERGDRNSRRGRVDAYGADDRRSMAADNTSAFNCRFVAGQPGIWSEHAYGRAIDLKPIENPYVTSSGLVSPPAGAPRARRSRQARGMIHRHGPVVKAFAAAGWEWGGNWAWPKDYQHFSATGN